MRASSENRLPSGRGPFGLQRLDSAAAVGLLVLRAMATTWLHLIPGVTSRQRADFDNLASVVSGAALAYAAVRVSTDDSVDGRTRRAWRWIGFACFCQFIGNLWWWSLDTLRHQSPLASWSDAVYLIFFPALLMGVLRLPHPARSREDATRYWLDVALVIVSAGITMWYFTQFGGALHSRGSPYALVYSIGYPLGDVLILVALAVLVIRSAADGGHRPLRLLAASMVLALVADALYAGWMKQGAYAPGSVLDILWALSAACLALAAWLERTDVERNMVRLARAAVPARPTYLAHGASTMLFAVLLYVGLSTGRIELAVLAIGAATITALTVARQMIAVRENVWLSTEAKAREGEARFRALVQHSSDVIFIVDVDSTIRFVSPAVLEVLGRSDHELLGQRLTEHVHPDDLAGARLLIARAASGDHDAAREECRMRHGDGRWIHMEHVATNLLAERIVNGIVLNSRDVTEREELQQRLTHQAFHDPLTNLANRTLFIDRAHHAMQRCVRDPARVALLFIDLDDFKKVNDSLGHAIGDALLVAVSERLRGTLREGDTLARLGGDEFAVLLEDVGGAERALDVADRVRRALREPIELLGKDIVTRVSVGIASAADASTPAELMRNADLAMYIAKARGKGRSTTYEPQMHADLALRLELEADLRQAIDRGELSLVYQPLVDLDTLALHGVESLLRWEHPVHGNISPAQFIPIAEEAGLIAVIGQWVLREATRQAREWRDATGVPILVGVNISGPHIQQGRLLDDVQDAVRRAGIDPSQLAVEITESTLIHRGDEVLEALRRLRGAGVTLALDDFGTGYSSLSYLQRFPIDVLKIDKSFIEGIAADDADPRLVRAIMALGESLNLRTVAEGIETREQLEALRALGCTMGQGYLFARPMHAARIHAVIRDGLVLPAVTSAAPAPVAT